MITIAQPVSGGAKDLNSLLPDHFIRIQKLGRISKMGNRNLRKLLVVGAHAVLFHRKPHTDPLRMWAKKLIEKKPFKLVAVALANKMARIAFAIMRGRTSLSGNFGVGSAG